MSTDGDFTEIGTGILDWPAIITAAQDAGATDLIIEQDRCQRPCLESVAISLQNLREMQ